MRKDDIANLIHAIPFQPFRLVITNGEFFEVRHPEMIAVTNGAIYVTMFGLSEEEKLDQLHNSIIVSLVHVVKIERLPFAQKPANAAVPEL